MTTKIQESVVLFKSHLNSGELKQENADLTSGEELVILWVLSMLNSAM